jgi:hypothetical protein
MKTHTCKKCGLSDECLVPVDVCDFCFDRSYGFEPKEPMNDSEVEGMYEFYSRDTYFYKY